MLATLALLALPQQIAVGPANGPSAPLEPTLHPQPWIETFGGGGADWFTSADPDGSGGVFVAGYTFSAGAGADDGWVARVRGNGRVRWELALGGTGADRFQAVAATADGGCLLAGSTTSAGAGGTDGWLVKLGPDGELQWERTFGTAGEESFADVAVVPGTAGLPRYLVGGTAALGKAGRDAWILELDESGAPLWQRSYGGKLDDDLTALAATSDGLVFVAASQSDFGGPPVAFTRPWLVRLDSTGEPLSQRVFDVSGGDVLSDITALPDGTFATTGEVLAFAFFRGDVWVQRLDADLDVLWDHRFGDSFLNWFDGGRRVCPTPDGGLLVAGSTATAGAGSDDLWLLRLDGAGNLLADRTFGAAGFDNGLALACDAQGRAFLGGITQIPASGGSFQGFLARIAVGAPFLPGAPCPSAPPTAPNQWSSALTVGTPAVVPVPTAVSPGSAASTLTPLATGALFCQ